MHLLENKTVLIIGLGLIGGSVARGLAAGRHCRRILACGRDEGPLQTALLDGVIDGYATTPDTLVPDADIILLATPTLTVARVLEQISDLLRADAIVTDAASVKGSVLADARRILGSASSRFVAGHPIAGSEQSGYQASRADLYQQRKVILTPVAENQTVAVQTVMQLWQCLGADVHAMSAGRHDRILAGTSHLPHLLAFALVNTLVDKVGEPDRPQQVFDYAAGGFADFSRIASSDPVMWRDIFLANREATVSVLDAYMNSLTDMKRLLLQADGVALQTGFARAKSVRDDFIRRFRAGQSALDVPEPESSRPLRVTPAVCIKGDCWLSSGAEGARAALLGALATGQKTLIRGFPEDRQSLQLVQKLNAAGTPISGPEQGELLVFAGDQKTVNLSLGADPLLIAVIGLAASCLPASSVVIRDGLGDEAALSGLPALWSELGLNLSVQDNKDLQIAALVTTMTGGTRLDVPVGSLSLAESLALVAWGLTGDQELEIALETSECAALWHRLRPWRDSGLQITLADSTTVQVKSGLWAADVHQIDCDHDTELALLTAALVATGAHEMTLTAVGDLAAQYPGLLVTLGSLGFKIKELV
ncbi:prephenate dehydrogenase [Pseudohongiella spirulinae]|uniref:3-phosphoshikimate 1-carboxyvinyltransferase n=1 Tax=Pseudohongiella spirulinae TaxID=1249552 RepID=A0A0S2KDT9_9GAMM|nr:prephenate dehydrogenase/arogenate dehydrogenase family protein [Pseudohongiella spirulinae]ALO46286.1 3-phosphoshikimate 1-carboxyvinyltransferase [Pseudohongiella spirulinae]